jgi:hypothetical protein
VSFRVEEEVEEPGPEVGLPVLGEVGRKERGGRGKGSAGQWRNVGKLKGER